MPATTHACAHVRAQGTQVCVRAGAQARMHARTNGRMYRRVHVLMMQAS